MDLGDANNLHIPRGNTQRDQMPNSQSVFSDVQSLVGISQAKDHGDLFSGVSQFGGNNMREKIQALKDKITALQTKLKVKEEFIDKQRKDYTRDLQNLRNALTLAVNPINRDHAEHVKLTIHVFNFNDMEGLSPDLVEFFNEKLNIAKELAQIEIDKVTQNVHQLIERIEKYKSLKPTQFGLMEMGLTNILEGVAVIEPLAFPIWKAMMQAYPEHHFTSIIKQVAEQLNEDKDDTYDKLLVMVNDGIASGTE